MKRCSKCRRPKPLSDFPKNRSRKDGHGHACKVCQRKYLKAHYEANKGYYKAKAKVHRDVAKAELDALLREAKGKPCTDCGNSYPYYVMDFDHVVGVKVADINSLRKKRSLKTILAEMAKCEVVCANCHRERTFVRRGHLD